jgi:hypothetical protein
MNPNILRRNMFHFRKININKEENKKTPLSRILLEKLIVTQLLKKFHAFHGT